MQFFLKNDVQMTGRVDEKEETERLIRLHFARGERKGQFASRLTTRRTVDAKVLLTALTSLQKR